MNKTIIYLSAVASFCYGCNQDEQIVLKDDIKYRPQRIDISSVVNDTSLSRFIQPINAISIRGRDSLYVAGGTKVIPFRNGYLYADFRLATILMLDPKGTELLKVGDLGSGRGRYTSVEDFNVDEQNDQILVFSNAAKTLYTYSTHGAFLRKDDLNFFAYKFSILDSKHLLFFLNQNTNNASGHFNLLVTDRSGKILQRLFPITKLPHIAVAYSGFIQRSDSSILYSEPFSSFVYEIKDSTYRLKYYAQFGDKTFPSSKYMSLKDLQYFSGNTRWIAGPVYESKDYIFLNFNDDRKLQPIAINKITGKSINGRSFKNKIIENLLFNVCGESNGVFYSIVDSDIVYPLLLDSKSGIGEIEKFDPALYSKITGAFPFKNPVLFSFKFIF